MPQIDPFLKQSPENPDTTWGKNLQLALRDYTAKLGQILNKGLRFEDNLSSYIGSTTTPGADVEFSISHGLKRVPVGYLVIGQDKAAVVYNGSTSWTADVIYLKCNTATVIVKVIIF